MFSVKNYKKYKKQKYAHEKIQIIQKFQFGLAPSHL